MLKNPWVFENPQDEMLKNQWVSDSTGFQSVGWPRRQASTPAEGGVPRARPRLSGTRAVGRGNFAARARFASCLFNKTGYTLEIWATKPVLEG